MVLRKVLLTGSLLAIAACSQQSSTEKLDKALKTIRSWTATAQMVGETWQQGSISDVYAKQTLQKSQQEIDRETQDVAIPAALQPPLRQIHQTLEQMATTIERHSTTAKRDPSELAVALQHLSTAQHQLDTLTQAQGEQP